MPTMNYIVPWLISGVSLLFAILSFARNGRKDKDTEKEKELEKKAEEVQALSSIRESLLKANMKLDQVCTTTNETRTDIKSLNKDVQDMKKQLAIHDRDIQTAFEKIDELRSMLNQ